MKILKKFGSFKDIPHVGDYVICHTEETHENKDIINNSIGYFDSMFSNYFVILFDKEQEKGQYDSIYNPKDLKKLRFSAYKHEIIHWSKNKKDLEAILNSTKFNI